MRISGGQVTDRKSGNVMREHDIVQTGFGGSTRLALTSIQVRQSDCTLIALTDVKSSFSSVVFEVAGLSEVDNPAVAPRNKALAEIVARCVTEGQTTELACRDAAALELRENGVGFSFYEFDGQRFVREFGLLHQGKIYLEAI